MEFESLSTVSSLMQSSVGFLSLGAFIPQWRTLHRTKCSKNISPCSWMLFSCSATFAWFYAFVQVGINGNGYALLATASLSVFCNCYSLYLLLKYRKAEPVLFQNDEQTDIEHDFQLSSEQGIPLEATIH
jgi:uncharacterized protein with PQ loop repeat